LISKIILNFGNELIIFVNFGEMIGTYARGAKNPVSASISRI